MRVRPMADAAEDCSARLSPQSDIAAINGNKIVTFRAMTRVVHAFGTNATILVPPLRGDVYCVRLECRTGGGIEGTA